LAIKEALFTASMGFFIISLGVDLPLQIISSSFSAGTALFRPERGSVKII